jgi:Ca2+-binding RTX toxin-like protein
VGGGETSANETFRIDFVTNLGTTITGGSCDQLGINHVFDNHYPTQGMSAVFRSTVGSTVLITAFNDSDADGNVVGPAGVIVPLAGVAIAFNNDNLFIDLAGPILPGYTVGGHLFVITGHTNGTVSVGGVVTGSEIAVFGIPTYNAVEYTYESSTNGSLPFAIGDFGASVPTTDPVSLNIPIELVDSDGDSLASMLGVTLTLQRGFQDHSADLVGALAFALADPHHWIGFRGHIDWRCRDKCSVRQCRQRHHHWCCGQRAHGGTGNDTLTGGTGLDRMIFGRSVPPIRISTATQNGGRS